MDALTPKEQLCQDENITSKTKARSYVIKENEAKNYISLCGGKARERATYAAPPPLKWRVPRGDPPKWPATDHLTTRHLSPD